jgi:hypothetical protein
MRKTLLLTSLLLSFFSSFCQSTATKPYYLKLSGGRVAFGTGDLLGPAIGIEAAKDVLKHPGKGVNRLLLGTEVLFETGVRNVVAINPTWEEFLSSFGHTTNLLLYPKLTYYPFGGFARGFNVGIGPSLGYSFQSGESQSLGRPTPNGDYIRYSVLTNADTWLIGYRISTGFEVGVTKKILSGIRVDFASYSNGDINTLVALKAGVRW